MYFYMTFTESTVYCGRYVFPVEYMKAGDIYCEYK